MAQIGNLPGMRSCFCVLAIVFTAIAANAQKLVTPGYLFNSDPTCHQINGQFYLFTTQDPFTTQLILPNEFYKGMFAYHALSTSDFDHWVDHGSVLTGRDAAWNSGGALWDGDAGIFANGQYYAYAPFRVNSASEANYGTYDIGVFVAKSPIGPYAPINAGPLQEPDGTPLEGLSPSVTYNDTETPFLIWGSGDTSKHEVMLAQLKPDMTHLAEMPRRLLVPKNDACGNLEYFESPMLFHIESKWYLTFVAYKEDRGPQCDAKGSYVDYVIADNMDGPFDGPVHHLVYPAGNGEESVQQGVCSYREKMYLAYHVPYENLAAHYDHHRQVAVTYLGIEPDGSLQPVYPGKDAGAGTPGVSHLTLDAFAPRREAAEFHSRLNASAEKGLSGEYQMKMGDGGYLCFHGMDFGQGAAAFRVEVSSENASLQNAVLEVHLDNPAGALVSKVAITSTGSATNYRLLASPVASTAKGVHDMCLVAHGDASPQARRLFNLTWFAFSPR